MSDESPPGRWQASDGQWYSSTDSPRAPTWVAVQRPGPCGRCGRQVHSGVRWWNPETGVSCRSCQVRAFPKAAAPPHPLEDQQRPSITADNVAEQVPLIFDRASVRRLRLSRDDQCAECGTETPAGVWAGWDDATKVVICEPCLDVDAGVDSGSPGLSAAMESWERREQLRLEALSTWSSTTVYNKFGDRHAAAYEKGMQGEQLIGGVLERLCGGGRARVLHDRAGSRNANIDHIAVTPTGVWVVDSKNHRGRVRPASGRFFGAPAGLRVNGVDRSELTLGSTWQVDVVVSAIDDPVIPVRLVLAFPRDSAFGWLRKRFCADGVWVCPPGQLESVLFGGPDVLAQEQLSALTMRLGRRLPPRR